MEFTAFVFLTGPKKLYFFYVAGVEKVQIYLLLFYCFVSFQFIFLLFPLIYIFG